MLVFMFPGFKKTSYDPSCDGPILHLPVELRGATIGHLWCSANPEVSAAGYAPVMAALGVDQRIDALIVWEDRLEELFKSGLNQIEALNALKGVPEHPTAGRVPDGAELEELPDSATLDDMINPGYSGPSLPSEPEEDPQLWPEMDRWNNFAPETIGKTYAPRTDQPVCYLPVFLQGRLIGYLWASVTDDAADFQPLLPPEVLHNRARGWWVGEFMRLQESGVSPLQALRSRIGAPEDPTGGRIDADAQERVAASLDELKEIAQR
ncbi:hypothetical protein ACOALZ_18800 [Nocardiopsis algeriensis]|uniref:hypothetical protein n=1 Tax=Nocardiopsis algeriensis TaxID=1478215 RepID=UPI003B42C478